MTYPVSLLCLTRWWLHSSKMTTPLLLFVVCERRVKQRDEKRNPVIDYVWIPSLQFQLECIQMLNRGRILCLRTSYAKIFKNCFDHWERTRAWMWKEKCASHILKASPEFLDLELLFDDLVPVDAKFGNYASNKLGNIVQFSDNLGTMWPTTW